jgi:peroxiredoxin Q/BCP
LEAREFRDMYKEFQRRGADVIGISGDDVETHRRFAEEHDLPFTLLSDVGDKVRDMYGAWSIVGTPDRMTFLIDRQGIVRMVFSSNIQPKKHISEALKELEAMMAEGTARLAQSS